MTYALDSNVIAAILNKEANIIGRYFQEIEQGNEFIIPPIVFYEVERGLLAKNLLGKRRAFIEFCRDVEVGEFDIHVWSKAAEIYAILSKRGKPIGHKFDGDVFIASYCLVNDYTLVTRNADDFDRIDDLRFVNWFE